jgi:hypothetical protein
VWPSLETLELKDLIELFCEQLSGKRILLVGPHAFHHVQTLLLEALAKHDKRPYTYGYPDSGRHYLVCRDAQKSQDPSFNLTHISFSLSDTLFPIQGDDEINGPDVDPRTGIRIQHSYWFKESWKAELLILNKGPIPAPASTYDGGTGNWSFTQRDNEAQEEETLSARIVKAAFDVIFQVYVPQLLHTLNVIAGIKSDTVFFGPWFQQPVCTNAGLDAKFRTTRLFWDPYDSVDPWSLYYNTQGRGPHVPFGAMIVLANCYPVYIIDRILPMILPYFNTTFIPMTVPLIIGPHGADVPELMDQRKDCFRPASDHPVGEAIGLTFLKTLLYQLLNQ